MQGIIAFAVWGLCGWACYNMATAKNRNKELWAVIGLLFGVFAVIAISAMPHLPGG